MAYTPDITMPVRARYPVKLKMTANGGSLPKF